MIALVDSTGTVVESYEYDAYGGTKVFDASEVELAESAIGNRYCFQGREINWSSKLYYFRARWYDPGSGRWLSKDPIGISGGLNQYVFVENDPVNSIDPSGLSAYAAVYDFSYSIGNADGPYPYADVVGMVILGAAIVYDDVADFISEMAEHKSNARPSTQEQHQKGQARKGKDASGGEKGDARRRPGGKRPKNWKGPWPPAAAGAAAGAKVE